MFCLTVPSSDSLQPQIVMVLFALLTFLSGDSREMWLLCDRTIAICEHLLGVIREEADGVCVSCGAHKLSSYKNAKSSGTCCYRPLHKSEENRHAE